MSLDSMPTAALVAQRRNYLAALREAAARPRMPWWAREHAARVVTLKGVLNARGVTPTPRPA